MSNRLLAKFHLFKKIANFFKQSNFCKKSNKILYLGLNKPEDEKDKIFIHYPVIRIIPKTQEECKAALNLFLNYTHLIFTSKTAVKIFFEYVSYPNCFQKKKRWIAVGHATKKALEQYGLKDILTPKEETAEGIVNLLKGLDLKNSYFLWPHSALSRPVIRHFFLEEKIKFEECVLYDTIPFWPGYPPNFNEIDEIVFTSASTVDAFFSFFQKLPGGKKLTAIGPITKAKIDFLLSL